MPANLHNWADNYSYRAERIHRPATVDDVQDLVSRARKAKALGTRHSFNDIADTTEDLISLENLDQIELLDRDRRTVTIQAGVRYGELCRYLDREGFSIHNLASLPHISVAGACATGTHGSGDRNGNLATAVAGLEVVTADGSIVEFSRSMANKGQFAGAVVALGGLGVVVRLSLDIQPAFELKQEVYERLPLSEFEARFDDITSSAYSVSMFTDWLEPEINQVWVKSLADEPARVDLFGAKPATMNLHPIKQISPENCTAQMGVPGAWHARLPHFRLEYIPSSGEELQSEYLVPRRHGPDAVRAIFALREQVAPLLQITELRTIAADDLWMSPCYRESGLAIHFTWKKNWERVRRLLPVIEESLEPFQARPHWGKLFSTSPTLLWGLYPRMADFRALLQSYDPDGKFRNPFLDRYVFGARP